MLRIASAALVGATLALAPPASAATNFVNVPYATWSNDEPSYRLYPGDEVEVIVPSAPELSKVVVVQPDGRIKMPLIQPVMAAERTAEELQQALTGAYSSQLRHPEVEVFPKAEPLKVFVGGEVGKPGIYDMPGDMDSLRAVVEAGGFTTTADRSQVVIIRRARDGHAMMRTVNLDRALHGDVASDLVPLRRFDIVYVPKTGLGELGDFMQGVRNALPIQFSYAFGAGPVVY